ncbi:MAG TPA: FtsW/RodA/SpoVE family cell cycle protein [Anaerolineales bacterium]|nr:FtsW/RodA/SpoVE family cell cycle protein [Anaerolineales bacterium]
MRAAIPLSPSRVQARLLLLAGGFLTFYAMALTLAPVARERSWSVQYPWEHWLGLSTWAVFFFLAHHQADRFLSHRDPYLLPIAALLSGWGLMTVWRLLPDFGLRQTAWLAVGLILLILGLRLPSHLNFLRRYKYVWLTGGLLLTALTLIFGTNPSAGTAPRLWLGCCGVYFQPSEPLKFLLVVYLAAYLADRQPLLRLSPISAPSPSSSRRRNAALLPVLAPTLVMTGLTLLLLLAQRDLGTASIFIFLFAAIVYLGTGRLSVVVVSALLLALASAAGYYLFDVVQLRVDAWLNPWLDPSGKSYQIVQSLLAVANGGIIGRGPGLGNPSLVPIPHSDFIFVAIAEESGLIGVVGLIALLALLGARGLRLALSAPDSYRRYLAAGLTAYLVGQSVLIAGGNLRLLPLTGVTLPFVSYGGSSLLSAFLSLLVLLHISQAAGAAPRLAPEPRPYTYLAGFLFAGLTALALVAGWWAVYRSPALLERTDNARRTIADRYVRRGSLLDRDNVPLAATFGSPGEQTREVLYPPLGPVLGYTHPLYGQAGLEASLDPLLRGLRGNPSLAIWWNQVLYGQPPPGRDIRLSLDLDLQSAADELLGDHRSALVLLNAQTGEILALASHPTFDPNRLGDQWPDLISDLRAPLFNRATLGSYPAGTALGPLLLAALPQEQLPLLPSQLDYRLEDQQLECAYQPEEPTWANAIAAGCPAAQAALANALGGEQVLHFYKELGLYTAPDLRLPTGSLAAPQVFQDLQAAYLGQTQVRVSPLQMALAAAVLNAAGVRPAPQLAMAVHQEAGWTVLPSLSQPRQVFDSLDAQAAANSLAAEGLPVWQSLSNAPNGPGKSVSWYLGGTLPSWKGAPLVLVVLLEDRDPLQAQKIGQELFSVALSPR